jgi:glutamyl-tRNA synthetase
VREPRGRFAPSPTGDLHLGGAYVALAAWLRIRARDGVFVVRIEDLDPPRVIPGATARILDDLRWLGLDWDEGPTTSTPPVEERGPCRPYAQSRRGPLYDAAIEELTQRALVYPCTCTRAEIARACSAPHLGEEGPRYPGTCRAPSARIDGRPSAIRLRIPDRAQVTFEDLLAGPREEDVAATVGDFVLRRADGVASYQLAVVVDDLAMEIDEVVRGDDLLPSTARQILLARLLGGRPPRYLHLPLVLGPDGTRLAKRHQARWSGSTIAELRAAGIAAEEIVGALAAALAVVDGPTPRSARSLVTLARQRPPGRTGPWTPPRHWIHPR